MQLGKLHHEQLFLSMNECSAKGEFHGQTVLFALWLLLLGTFTTHGKPKWHQ